MESLIKLEELLLEENSEGVKGYLSEIDRKTANDCMKAMGEAMGFQVIEINGICYAHLGRTSEILGYSDVSGLRKLMERYQIMTPKIGWFGLEVQKILRETFNLDPKDGQATFIPYEGILLSGMQGQTEGARKIKVYLLKAERAFRIGMASEIVLTTVKAEWMGYRLAAQRVKDEISLIGQVERIKDGPFKEAAIEALERLTGKTFPRPKQLHLPFTSEVK